MQTLIVAYTNGTTENIRVYCGRSKNARRIPARIGRALIEGQAKAVLAYDNKARTAVLVSGRYYMRIA